MPNTLSPHERVGWHQRLLLAFCAVFWVILLYCTSTPVKSKNPACATVGLLLIPIGPFLKEAAHMHVTEIVIVLLLLLSIVFFLHASETVYFFNRPGKILPC